MFHFYARWKFQKQPSEVFYKNSQGLFFNKVLGLSQQLYQIETLTQVFPSELCKIFKNFFYWTPPGKTLLKPQKTSGFLTFSEGIESNTGMIWNWREMS